MTINCRKTCSKCGCKCCSFKVIIDGKGVSFHVSFYKGKQHALGTRIPLPEKCAELQCVEGLRAEPSPLLDGASNHSVNHPEELTLEFKVLHHGSDCCILPTDNGRMVEDGKIVLLTN